MSVRLPTSRTSSSILISLNSLSAEILYTNVVNRALFSSVVNLQPPPVPNSPYFTSPSLPEQQSNPDTSSEPKEVKKKSYNTDPDDIHYTNLKSEISKINLSPLKRGLALKNRIREIQTKFIKNTISRDQLIYDLSNELQMLDINNVNFQKFIKEIFHFADHTDSCRTWGENVSNTASINKILAELHYYHSSPKATKAFFAAVKEKDEASVQSALEKSKINKITWWRGCADINALDEEGKNVLHWAAKENSEEIFNILLPNMSIESILAEDNYEKTALDYAVEKNYFHIIMMLSDKLIQVIDAQTEEIRNQIIELQLFLSNIDNSTKTAFFKLKTLEKSIIFFFTLIEKNFDRINSIDSDKKTIFHHLLLKNNFYYSSNQLPEIEENQTETVEYNKDNNLKIIKYLISKMSFETITAVDRDDNTALHLAIKMGYSEITELILHCYKDHIPELKKRIELLKEEELKCNITHNFAPKEQAIMIIEPKGEWLYDKESITYWIKQQEKLSNGTTPTNPTTRNPVSLSDLKEVNPKFQALYSELESMEKLLKDLESSYAT